MKTILTSHVLMIIMFLPLLGNTQLVTISGDVTHGKSGNVLKNVSIFETFSSIGTITNEEGFFKLELPQGELEIKVTDHGFREFTQKILLKNDTTLSFVLEPELQNRNRQKKQEDLHADAKIMKKTSGRRPNK